MQYEAFRCIMVPERRLLELRQGILLHREGVHTIPCVSTSQLLVDCSYLHRLDFLLATVGLGVSDFGYRRFALLVPGGFMHGL